MNTPHPTSRRDGVRAILGRLFRRTRAYRLDLAVGRSGSRKQDLLAFSAIARDGKLPLALPSHRWDTPRADTGGEGVNLDHIAANVSSGDAGLSTRALGLTLPASQHVAVLQTGWPVVSPSAAVPLRWSGGQSRRAPFVFARSRSRFVGLLPQRPGGTREGLAWFTQNIPLLRERLPVEEDEGGQTGARMCLAAASGAEEEDIQVVGVYPRVPLTCVRQMSLADGGRHLRLWLYSPKSRKPVRLWTVMLGRLRSSGRTVQTIVEEKVEDISA